jgi:hypothetical protein
MVHLSSPGGEISLNHEFGLKSGDRDNPVFRQMGFTLDKEPGGGAKMAFAAGEIRTLNPPLTKLLQISSIESNWSST